MKCPDGMLWIEDREFCSKCPFGYIWNAEWSECVKMAKVAEPAMYHTSSAAFGFAPIRQTWWKWLVIVAVVGGLIYSNRSA